MQFSKFSLAAFLTVAATGQAATITPLVDGKVKEADPNARDLNGGSSKLRSGAPSSQMHKVKKLSSSTGSATMHSSELKKLMDTAPVEEAQQEVRPQVVGGDTADYGEYEYYTQLLYSTGDRLCGGSLIAPNVVLSAAHCYFSTLDRVSVGTYEFSYGYYESGYSELADVLDIAVHPDYVGDEEQYDMDNDIMLLKIDEEMDELKVVTLNTNSNKPANGDAVTVIGLGQTTPEYSSSIAYTLQELEMQVVDTDQCFPAGHVGNEVVNDSTEFCAGAVQGESSCQGDSGGPIFEIDRTTGEHIQLGVVSYGGAVCATQGESGVYSRVSANMDFIERTVCDEWGISASFCGSGSGSGSGPSPSPPSEASPDETDQSPDYPDAEEGDCGYGETYILFEMGVDSWGGEVSWDLRYASGGLIQSDTGFADGEIRSYDGCLSENASSCYYLTIYDSACDGMADPYGGMDPYIYIVWGTESYLDMPEYTCDISIELCH